MLRNLQKMNMLRVPDIVPLFARITVTITDKGKIATSLMYIGNRRK